MSFIITLNCLFSTKVEHTIINFNSFMYNTKTLKIISKFEANFYNYLLNN